MRDRKKIFDNKYDRRICEDVEEKLCNIFKLRA